MKQIQTIVSILMGTVCVVNGWAQLNQDKPAIGYVFPAGARQGTTVQILAGGQSLRGANDVYVSGEGVSGTVVRFVREPRNLNGDQRKELQRRLKAVVDKRFSELSPKQRNTLGIKEPPSDSEKKNAKADAPADVKLPALPMLDDLENKSLAELAHIVYALRFPRSKLQLNRQLSELVLIELTVDSDAKPGFRELRLHTRGGLTNPMVFQVGLLPEISELEPNDEANAYVLNTTFKPAKMEALKDYLKPEPMILPVVVNGQIMPGDVDRFRFRAKTGQQVVINTHARSLIPYLADAVPGWFQATVTLYNAAGTELAFADDYRFNPDPVLVYQIPRNGYYELEIRDSIYRGRQDFVYRVAIGELPFITQMFPLGGKVGSKTVASIDGWNLGSKKLPLDMKADSPAIRHAMLYDTKTASNTVPYAVDTLPECNESETNNSIKSPQKIDLGVMINGTIASPGDIDVFAFKAKAGDPVAAEVFARRLNSPLDSMLRLTDASGTVLAWNDDYVLKDSHLYKDSVGLMTHHADAYLKTELPKDGTYYIHLADSQHHGSAAHGYRLRLTKVCPDFELRVTPSSLNFLPGGLQPVEVHVLRKDGFDGEINLALKDAPDGFTLNGGRIPAGCERITMTVGAPEKPRTRGAVRLTFEGSAVIGDRTLRRTAVPADDVMQAFLYRHLVPAQELLATIGNVKWSVPPFEVASKKPVQIPIGSTAEVKLQTPRKWILNQLRLELYQPPEGISLGDVNVRKNGLAVLLKADPDCLSDGFEDNLIIEAWREFIPEDKDGKPTGPQRRNWVGILPAIPIQIVPAAETDSSTKAALRSQL